MLYAKSTNGFYDPAIHGTNIPADAVEISHALYVSLFEDQAAGKCIQADANGYPVALAPSADEIRAHAWERIKAERDSRTAGGVLVGSHWFHSDADSRIKWLGTKDSARDVIAAGGATTDRVYVDGEALVWKTMAGEFVPVDVALAFAVVEATKVLDKRLFATAEAKRVELEASGNPAAYDVLAGWPETFAE